MKILLVIAFILSGVSVHGGESLENLQVAYRSKTLNLKANRDDQIDTLNKQFIKALTKIKEGFQKAGDLDRALLVKAEIDLITAKTWPFPALPQPLERKVKSMRKTYLKSRVGFERKWALAAVQAGDTMEKALANEVDTLTKAGKLEDAKKGRELLEKLKADPELARARELPNRLTSSGRSKAAFILRRPGDNIEVLVRYDRSGKVSMQSPIENLIERTGGKGEKGNTTAKSLGEFVGAEDFEVDPYVAFDENTTKGKIAFSGGSGVRSTTIETIDGQRAQVLEIVPKAKNAYLNLDGVVPIAAHAGSVKVLVEYYVPAENRSAIGMDFRHGSSAGKLFGTAVTRKGAWTEESRTGTSSTELSNLRIHFPGVDLGEMKDAWGDKIYLRHLKILHTRFSALVVEGYDTSGGLVIKELSAEKQKLFIKNGEILPK